MPSHRERDAVSHYKKETIRLQQELTRSRAAEMGFRAGLGWTLFNDAETVIALGMRIVEFEPPEFSGSVDYDSTFLPPTNELWADYLAREFKAPSIDSVLSSPSLRAAFSNNFCRVVRWWVMGARETALAFFSEEYINQTPEVRRLVHAGECQKLCGSRLSSDGKAISKHDCEMRHNT